ncbi:hypothetical protein BH10ACT9_BH10ACT9_28130 [soil metagenome]
MLNTLPFDGGGVGTSRTRLVEDELDAVASAVHEKYPLCPRAEVTAVVLQSYRYLAEHATIRAHLIPLTLNRSLRMMRASAQDVTPDPNRDVLGRVELPTG